MTARETLDSFGGLLERCAALDRERRACLARLKADAANAGLWQRRADGLREELARCQRQIAGRERRVLALLDRLGDPMEQEVLRLRYLSLMPYAEIGEALHFSERHIYRLHVRGVRRLQEALDRAEQENGKAG